MRLLKRLAIIVASVLIAVGALGWYLTARFDSDEVRGALTRSVAERYDRTLRIDGRLALSFWPRLALDAGQVSLSARGQPAQPFAAVEHMRVHVALWPLLSQRVEVQELRLDGVRLHLARDLLRGFDPVAARGGGDGAAVSAVSFDLRRITLADGQLELNDTHNNIQLTLRDVSGFVGPISARAPGALGLEGRLDAAGALAAQGNFRLTAGFQLEADNATLRVREAGADFVGQMAHYPQGEVHLRGGAVAAHGEGVWQGGDVSLSVSARAADDTLELALAVPQWQWRGGVHAAQVDATLARTAPSVGGALVVALRNLRPAGEGPAADSLTVNGHLTRGERSHALNLAAVPGWKSDDETLVLNALDASLGLPDVTAAHSVRATGQLAWQPGSGEVDAAGALDDGVNRVSGTLRVAPQATPWLRFDARSPLLAVDAWWPTLRAAATGLGPHSPAISGRVQADTLTFGALVLSSVVAPIEVSAGALQVGPVDAALFNGRLHGRFARDVAGGAQVSGQLTGIALEQWQTALAQAVVLEGGLDADLDLRFDSLAVDGWSSLSGEATLRLSGGALRGFDVHAEMARDSGAVGRALASLATLPPAHLRMDATRFAVDRGRARATAMALRTPLLALRGEAQVELASGALTAVLAAVPAGLETQVKAVDRRALKAASMALTVGGTLGAPQWTVGDVGVVGAAPPVPAPVAPAVVAPPRPANPERLAP